MTKPEGTLLRCKGSGFSIRSSLGVRHSALRGAAAFTLLELLIVMTIIIVLAGLTFATMAYVQGKARRSRTEAELAAISTALENYKTDNGEYPRDADTDNLDPTTSTNPLNYAAANLKLYQFLSGDTDGDRKPDAKSYFAFKPNQLTPTDQTRNVTGFIDPFGNNYGYSTMRASNPAANGYNPTFDLWSTGGSGTGATPTPNPPPTPASLWIKNW